MLVGSNERKTFQHVAVLESYENHLVLMCQPEHEKIFHVSVEFKHSVTRGNNRKQWLSPK